MSKDVGAVGLFTVMVMAIVIRHLHERGYVDKRLIAANLEADATAVPAEASLAAVCMRSLAKQLAPEPGDPWPVTDRWPRA